MSFWRLILSRLDGMDAHLREVLNGTALAFGLRIIGAAAAFGLNVAIGRILGADGAGLYFLALSVASFAAIVAQLGLGNSLLRFISAAASKDDWGRVQGVFAQGLKHALVAGLAIAVLIAATATWSANTIFGKPDLAEPLRWISLAVVSFSVMSLVSASLKGLKQIGRAMLVAGVIYPLVALLLIWPFAQYAGPAGASMAYVAGTGVAALIGLVWWVKAVRGKGVAVPIPPAELWASARPLMFNNLIMRGAIPIVPMFFVGAWSDAADAGIFGAATRLALLASFFLTAVNTAVAPKFSELYSKGDMKALAHVARRVSLWLTLATSPVFLVLFFAGDRVMGLFGPAFSSGGTVLAILALGQLASAISGPVGFLLTMSGYERDVRNASIVAALLMLVLAVALIPSYGSIGAAISATSALFVINAFSVIMVYWRMNIVMLPLPGKV